jgi:hypothetical protein
VNVDKRTNCVEPHLLCRPGLSVVLLQLLLALWVLVMSR